MTGLEDAGKAKVQRWQRILEEATEQCGRARRPELLPIRPLTHALSAIPEGAIALMLWEEEQDQSLHNVLRTVSLLRDQDQHVGAGQSMTVVLFIGPEGGLLKEEIELAQQYGVQSVTLGTRILRAETAALAAVANVMYELEARLAFDTVGTGLAPVREGASLAQSDRGQPSPYDKE
jgi:16S rRNA (uracil1498-N3)-methyltransferase